MDTGREQFQLSDATSLIFIVKLELQILLLPLH